MSAISGFWRGEFFFSASLNGCKSRFWDGCQCLQNLVPRLDNASTVSPDVTMSSTASWSSGAEMLKLRRNIFTESQFKCASTCEWKTNVRVHNCASVHRKPSLCGCEIEIDV